MLSILNIFICFIISLRETHFGAARFYQEQLVVDTFAGDVKCFQSPEVLLRTFRSFFQCTEL